MRLKDKVVVITGAGGGRAGMGKSHAKMMAREGAKVVVNDIDLELAKKVVEEIKTEGGEAVAVGGSVASWDSCRNIIETAIKNFGRIDVLINNAGISRDRMVWNMTEEEWDAVIDVDLKGTFMCAHFAVPYMREQKSGKIINVTSSVGLKGNPGQTNYAAAKGGVVAMTKSLAKELGRYGINVNCISPRAQTPKSLEQGEIKIAPGKVRGELTTEGEMKSDRSVLGRIGRPEEVSAVVVFLASDEANYVTGQIIGVDGGTIDPPGLMG